MSNCYATATGGEIIPMSKARAEELSNLLVNADEIIGVTLRYSEKAQGAWFKTDGDGDPHIEDIRPEFWQELGKDLRAARMIHTTIGIAYTADKEAPGTFGGTDFKIYSSGETEETSYSKKTVYGITRSDNVGILEETFHTPNFETAAYKLAEILNSSEDLKPTGNEPVGKNFEIDGKKYKLEKFTISDAGRWPGKPPGNLFLTWKDSDLEETPVFTAGDAVSLFQTNGEMDRAEAFQRLLTHLLQWGINHNIRPVHACDKAINQLHD